MKTSIVLIASLLMSVTTATTFAQTGSPVGPLSLAGGQVLFSEDFEAGWGDWYADNGVWDIGVPASRSGRAFRGEVWAGTILDDDYPGYQDSRLISPLITLPAVSGDERIELSLWHWFSYSSYDSGTVQVSVYNPATGQWGDWVNLAAVSGVSSVWSPLKVDLTAYANSYVQLGLLHTAGRNSWGSASESSGWYVEELEIRKGTPLFRIPEDFESDWGDWFAENGIWEVGKPSAGPDAAYSGNTVAGTVLDGDYPGYTSSRLVSPLFSLPELTELALGETLTLKFWHWFSYSSYDSGTVQISVYDPSTGQSGDWQNLTTIDGVAGTWSPMRVDLADYAGDCVRIAFLHAAGRNSWGSASESTGWYIDDVQIPEGTKQIVLYDYPLDSDPAWEMDGPWEYGIPVGQGGVDHGYPDPAGGYTGQYVLGVNLDGDYDVTSDACYALVSGPFDLSGYEDVTLEFARWLNTDEPDYVADAIEVSIDGGETWYPVWQHTASGPLTDAGWTVVQYALGALTDDQPTVHIRWSFQVLDARAFAHSGWNIDDVKLIGQAQ